MVQAYMENLLSLRSLMLCLQHCIVAIVQWDDVCSIKKAVVLVTLC